MSSIPATHDPMTPHTRPASPAPPNKASQAHGSIYQLSPFVDPTNAAARYNGAPNDPAVGRGLSSKVIQPPMPTNTTNPSVNSAGLSAGPSAARSAASSAASPASPLTAPPLFPPTGIPGGFNVPPLQLPPSYVSLFDLNPRSEGGPAQGQLYQVAPMAPYHMPRSPIAIHAPTPSRTTGIMAAPSLLLGSNRPGYTYLQAPPLPNFTGGTQNLAITPFVHPTPCLQDITVPMDSNKIADMEIPTQLTVNPLIYSLRWQGNRGMVLLVYDAFGEPYDGTPFFTRIPAIVEEDHLREHTYFDGQTVSVYGTLHLLPCFQAERAHYYDQTIHALRVMQRSLRARLPIGYDFIRESSIGTRMSVFAMEEPPFSMQVINRNGEAVKLCDSDGKRINSLAGQDVEVVFAHYQLVNAFDRKIVSLALAVQVQLVDN